MSEVSDTSDTSDTRPIALVTGGNRGIGLAIATALESDGCDVVITYRGGSAPEGFKSVVMDVTSEESVEAAFTSIEEQWGIPEIIVANAGITKDTLVLRMSEEDFSSVINTNLTGAFRVAKRATKGLLKLKRGRLIFIGSVVGGVGAAGQVNYSASKAGLVGMARSFARELGTRSITANVIAPGFVETDMTADLDEKRRGDIATQVPLGRFCSAEEIADVVTFIASPKASYITGAIIPVDGGLGMGH
jgi:3-oxoacyl-[acyl-carrier protein] reductase